MTQSPFVCGGPVGIGSSVYVTRAADTNAINAIQKKEYISIFGPRQVGKTSLLHQIQASVESQYNYATAIIDLSSINDPSINFREWSRQLCNLIDDQIKPFVERKSPISPPRDFAGFRTYWGQLAGSIKRPSILILFDEANSVPMTINDPFYSTIRSIYGNKKSYRPDKNLSKINFAFAGVFEPERLVTNRDNSPFNVSKKIRLGDFSKEELSLLTSIFEKASGCSISVDWIHNWTSGQPYLSQVLLDLAFKRLLPMRGKIKENLVSELIPVLLDEASDNVDHTVKLVLNDLDKRNRLLQIINGKKIPFSRASRLTAQLELDGIIKDDGGGGISIRNKIYEDVLIRTLEMPQTDLLTSPDKIMNEPRSDIFISYSHADDEKYIKKLRTHLNPLVRKNKIVLWDDAKIKPGQKWFDEIQAALQNAKVAILMVSPDFLASSFINDHELPKILDAAEKKGLTIIWIPISTCAYKDSVVEPYQAVISPDHPLNKMTSGELDDALYRVYEAIKEIVE